MEKKELKKQLEGIESIMTRLSGILSAIDIWKIDDDKLKSDISDYLVGYHIKAADLVRTLKNMD